MEEKRMSVLQNMELAKTEKELRACNDWTEQFGLVLSDVQIQGIVHKRQEALRSTGRIEFGDGVLRELIFAFCDSPYIGKDNYYDTLQSLIEAFYYFKNESEDMIADDELIRMMKEHFDTVCQGSLEYLEGTTLEELCRNTRRGYPYRDGLD